MTDAIRVVEKWGQKCLIIGNFDTFAVAPPGYTFSLSGWHLGSNGVEKVGDIGLVRLPGEG